MPPVIVDVPEETTPVLRGTPCITQPEPLGYIPKAIFPWRKRCAMRVRHWIRVLGYAAAQKRERSYIPTEEERIKTLEKLAVAHSARMIVVINERNEARKEVEALKERIQELETAKKPNKPAK